MIAMARSYKIKNEDVTQLKTTHVYTVVVQGCFKMNTDQTWLVIVIVQRHNMAMELLPKIDI